MVEKLVDVIEELRQCAFLYAVTYAHSEKCALGIQKENWGNHAFSRDN